MQDKRSCLTERVIESYSSYYDIVRMTDSGRDAAAPAAESYLAAECDFNMHSEKYFLTKKASLWAVNSFEHVYIFNVPNLTADIYKECTEYAHIRGMGKIIPGPEHMCSYITTVFICDSADASAISRLRRCRIHKDFRFSLYGWMDMHTAAVIVNDGKVVTNFSGRDNAKNLKTIYLSK